MVIRDEEFRPQYRVVREADAETILLVQVAVPGSQEPLPWRFPIRRDPTGTFPGLTTNLNWCAAGQHGGCGGSLWISGHEQPDAPVTVSVSVRWTAPDGARGQAAGELRVPWWGEARGGLAQDAWVRAAFVKPER